MSFVLDGIPTAMRQRDFHEGGSWMGQDVRCPCEWSRRRVCHNGVDNLEEHLNALRFHYTHCPMARVTQEEKP